MPFCDSLTKVIVSKRLALPLQITEEMAEQVIICVCVIHFLFLYFVDYLACRISSTGIAVVNSTAFCAHGPEQVGPARRLTDKIMSLSCQISHGRKTFDRPSLNRHHHPLRSDPVG